MSNYAGRELELFKAAQNWKAYWSSAIDSELSGDVLEVGSGIGANTRFLLRKNVRTITSLEPDEALVHTSKLEHRGEQLPIRSLVGTTCEIDRNERFDTVVYIDVLEHIENDSEEFQRAASLLKPNGKLIVLAPAHQFLFSEFDQSIGHHRRYNKVSMEALRASNLQCLRVYYLDSVGMLASLLNKYLLKSPVPKLRQIQFWDGVMVPLSRRIFDRLFGFKLGKTVIGVWERVN